MAAEEAAPKREPHGPGLLMIFGLALAALAAYCAYDLFGGSAEEWQSQGKEWYVHLNWAVMILAILGTVYAWVLAAVRSKKGIGTPPPQPPTGPDRPEDR